MFTLGDVAEILDDAFDMGINIVDALAKLAEAGDKGRITREACMNELEMPDGRENVERCNQRDSLRDVESVGGNYDHAREPIQAFNSYRTIHDLSNNEDVQSGILLESETGDVAKRMSREGASGVQDLGIDLQKGSSDPKFNSSGPSPLKISSYNIASTENNSQVGNFDNENDEIVEDDDFYDTPLQTYGSKRWSTTFALNLEEDDFCPVDTKTEFHSVSRQVSTSSYGSSEREGIYTASPERELFDWDEEIPRAKRQRSNTYSIETTPVSEAEERGLPIIDILDDLCSMADQWLTDQKHDTDSQGYNFEYRNDGENVVEIESEDEISARASNLLEEQIYELDKETARAHDIVNRKGEFDLRKGDRLDKTSSQLRRGSETEIESNLGDSVQQKISDIGSQAAIVLKSFEALKNLRHYDESGESMSSRAGSDKENSGQFLDEGSTQNINKGFLRTAFNVSLVPDERGGMLAKMERDSVSTGEENWNVEQSQKYDQDLADFEELEHLIEESEKGNPVETLEGFDKSEKVCIDQTKTEETYIDGGFREKFKTDILPSEFQMVYENAQRVADLEEVESSEKTDAGGNFKERYRAESVPSNFQVIEDLTLDYFDDHVEIVNEIEFENRSEGFDGVPGDKKRPGTYVLKDGQSGSLSSVYEEPVYIRSDKINEDTKARKRLANTFVLGSTGSCDGGNFSRGEDSDAGGSVPKSLLTAQKAQGKQASKRPGTFVLDNDSHFGIFEIVEPQTRQDDQIEDFMNISSREGISESAKEENQQKKVQKRPGTYVLDSRIEFGSSETVETYATENNLNEDNLNLVSGEKALLPIETRGTESKSTKRPGTFVLDSNRQLGIPDVVDPQTRMTVSKKDRFDEDSGLERKLSGDENCQKRQARKRPGTYVLENKEQSDFVEMAASRSIESLFVKEESDKASRKSSLSAQENSKEKQDGNGYEKIVMSRNEATPRSIISQEFQARDESVLNDPKSEVVIKESRNGRIRKRPGTYVLNEGHNSSKVEIEIEKENIPANDITSKETEQGSEVVLRPDVGDRIKISKRKRPGTYVLDTEAVKFREKSREITKDKEISANVNSSKGKVRHSEVAVDSEEKPTRDKGKRPGTFFLDSGSVGLRKEKSEIVKEEKMQEGNNFEESFVLKGGRRRPGTYILDGTSYGTGERTDVSTERKTVELDAGSEIIESNSFEENKEGRQRNENRSCESVGKVRRRRPGTYVLQDVEPDTVGSSYAEEVDSENKGIGKESTAQSENSDAEISRGKCEAEKSGSKPARKRTYVLDQKSHYWSVVTSEIHVDDIGTEIHEVTGSRKFKKDSKSDPNSSQQANEPDIDGSDLQNSEFGNVDVGKVFVDVTDTGKSGIKLPDRGRVLEEVSVSNTFDVVEHTHQESKSISERVDKNKVEEEISMSGLLPNKSDFTGMIEIAGKIEEDSGDGNTKASAKRDLVDGVHDKKSRKTGFPGEETLSEHVMEMKTGGEFKGERRSTNMKSKDHIEKDVGITEMKPKERMVWNVLESSLAEKPNIEERFMHKSCYKGMELRKHIEYTSASDSSTKREIRTDLTKQNSDKSNAINSSTDEQNRCFSKERNSEELNNNEAKSIEDDETSFSIDHSEMADEKVVLSTHSTRDCFPNENYHKGTAGFNIQKEPVKGRITNSTNTTDFITRDEIGYLSPENDNSSRISTGCKEVRGVEGDRFDKESVDHPESRSNHERNHSNQSNSLNFNGSFTNFDAIETKTEIAESCYECVAEHLNDSNQGIASSDISAEEMARNKIALKLEINLSDLTDDFQVPGDDSRRGNYSGSAKASEKSEFDSSYERAAAKNFEGSCNEDNPNFDNNNQKIQLKLEIDKCKSPENGNSNASSSQGIRFDIEFEGDSKKATSPPEELKKRLSVKSYSKVKDKTGTYVVNSPIFNHDGFTTESAFEESFARSSLGSSGGEDLQREIKKAIEEGRLELERTRLEDSPDREIYPLDIKKSLSGIDGKVNEEKETFAEPLRKQNAWIDENSVVLRDDDKTVRTTDRKLKTRTYVLESNSEAESENVCKNSENISPEKSQVENSVRSQNSSPRAASPRNKDEKTKTVEKVRKPDKKETLEKFRKSFGKQRIGFFVDLNKEDSRGQDENDVAIGRRGDLCESKPRKLEGTGDSSKGKPIQKGSESGLNEVFEKCANNDASSSGIPRMETSPGKGEENQTQDFEATEERDCFDVNAEKFFEMQKERLETKTHECTAEAVNESFEMKVTEYCESQTPHIIATYGGTSVSVAGNENDQITNLSDSSTTVNQSGDTSENRGIDAGYSLRDDRRNTGENIWTSTFIEDKSLPTIMFNNSSSMFKNQEVHEEASCGDLKRNLDTVKKNRDKRGIIVHNNAGEDEIRIEEFGEIEAEIQSEIFMQNETVTPGLAEVQTEVSLKSEACVDKGFQKENSCFSEDSTLVKNADRKQDGDTDVIVLRRQTLVDGGQRTRPTRHNSWEISPVVEKEVLQKISTLQETRKQSSLEETRENRRLDSAGSDEDHMLDGNHIGDSEIDKRIIREGEDIVDSPRRRGEFFIVDYYQPLESQSEKQSPSNDGGNDPGLAKEDVSNRPRRNSEYFIIENEVDSSKAKRKSRSPRERTKKEGQANEQQLIPAEEHQTSGTGVRRKETFIIRKSKASEELQGSEENRIISQENRVPEGVRDLKIRPSDIETRSEAVQRNVANRQVANKTSEDSSKESVTDEQTVMVEKTSVAHGFIKRDEKLEPGRAPSADDREEKYLERACLEETVVEDFDLYVSNGSRPASNISEAQSNTEASEEEQALTEDETVEGKTVGASKQNELMSGLTRSKEVTSVHDISISNDLTMGHVTKVPLSSKPSSEGSTSEKSLLQATSSRRPLDRQISDSIVSTSSRNSALESTSEDMASASHGVKLIDRQLSENVHLKDLSVQEIQDNLANSGASASMPNLDNNLTMNPFKMPRQGKHQNLGHRPMSCDIARKPLLERLERLCTFMSKSLTKLNAMSEDESEIIVEVDKRRGKEDLFLRRRIVSETNSVCSEDESNRHFNGLQKGNRQNGNWTGRTSDVSYSECEHNARETLGHTIDYIHQPVAGRAFETFTVPLDRYSSSEGSCTPEQRRKRLDIEAAKNVVQLRESPSRISRGSTYVIQKEDSSSLRTSEEVEEGVTVVDDVVSTTEDRRAAVPVVTSRNRQNLAVKIPAKGHNVRSRKG